MPLQANAEVRHHLRCFFNNCLISFFPKRAMVGQPLQALPFRLYFLQHDDFMAWIAVCDWTNANAATRLTSPGVSNPPKWRRHPETG